MTDVEAGSPRRRTEGSEGNASERNDGNDIAAMDARQGNPTPDDYAEVPQRMRDARRWLVWKATPNADPSKKPRKVPFYCDGKPRFGALDADADRARLGSFDEAMRALATGRYAGLGFALGPDGAGGCWQGVDIDYPCLKFDPRLITDELPGYTEDSPSGMGRHAIGYGRSFDPLGSNGSGIEAYAGGRFFTVTGEGAGLGDICDLAGFVTTNLRPRHSARGEAVAQDVAEPVTEEQRRDLRSALAYLDADDREMWVAIAHALKPLAGVGRGLWFEWSQQSDKFDATDAARVWNSAKPDRTGYEAVFAKAQAAGWLNPRKGALMAGTAKDTPAELEAIDLAGFMATELPQAGFVLHPVFPRGVVTLLGGHGGVGKSYLALALCAHVAAGRPWGPYAIDRPERVAFLSFEDAAAIVLPRLRRVCEVYQLDPAAVMANLRIVDGTNGATELAVVHHVGGVTSLRFTAAMEAVREAASGAGLVLIDNASDTFGGNENDRAQVRAFMRGLGRLARVNDAAVALLAHIDKAAARAGGRDNNYSGSTAWHNSARSRLALIETEAGIELVHEKSNLGPRGDAVAIKRGPHGVPLPADPAEMAAAARSARNIESAGDEEEVYQLLATAGRDGITVPAAHNTMRKTLAALAEAPEWMRSKDRGAGERFRAAILALARTGRIFEAEYRADGKLKRKWRIAELAESEKLAA